MKEDGTSTTLLDETDGRLVHPKTTTTTTAAPTTTMYVRQTRTDLVQFAPFRRSDRDVAVVGNDAIQAKVSGAVARPTRKRVGRLLFVAVVVVSLYRFCLSFWWASELNRLSLTLGPNQLLARGPRGRVCCRKVLLAFFKIPLRCDARDQGQDGRLCCHRARVDRNGVPEKRGASELL